MSNYEGLQDLWSQGYDQGYDQGLQDGLSSSEAAYTRGFSMGFWSALLLISAVVFAGLLMMRVV